MFGKAIALIVLPSCLFAFEMTDTALQLPQGKMRAIVYYADSSYTSVLQVSVENTIQVNTSSGTQEYFGSVDQSVACRVRPQRLIAKASFAISDGLISWVKAGSESSGLEIPSGSGENRGLSPSPGMLAGAGVRWRLQSDTIVTPAIALDFGITYADHQLNEYYTGTLMRPVDNRLELLETQAAVFLSKANFYNTRTEPYAGIGVYRCSTRLTDRIGRAQVAGYVDDINVFAGIKLQLSPLEYLHIEASFFRQVSLSVGIGMEI